MSDQPTKKTCPVCEKPTESEFAPFCSARCQDVDLNRWLSDGYRIAGNSDEFDGQSLENLDQSDGLDPSTTASQTRH